LRPDERRGVQAGLSGGIDRAADRVGEPVAEPGPGHVRAKGSFEARAGSSHRGGHGALARKRLMLEDLSDAALDADAEDHSGTSSMVQTSRSRSRSGLPWMR